MLSGDKGMGKSLFAKLLSIKANSYNIPVIIVDQYIEGISSFLESIEQEVMVMFDEFDKTFKSNKELNPQNELLTLIDGFNSGKKLFVITCNKIQDISEYFINRTGRFHYHFRFEYPNPEEISEYMIDNLHSKETHKFIKDVIDFSIKIPINYDTLRSIVFELNNGETFKSCINDLNITKNNNDTYEVCLKLKNKKNEIKYKTHIDLFLDNINFTIYDDEYYSIQFDKKDIYSDISGKTLTVNNVKCEINDDDGNLTEREVEYINIKKYEVENLRYLL